MVYGLGGMYIYIYLYPIKLPFNPHKITMFLGVFWCQKKKLHRSQVPLSSNCTARRKAQVLLTWIIYIYPPVNLQKASEHGHL